MATRTYWEASYTEGAQQPQLERTRVTRRHRYFFLFGPVVERRYVDTFVRTGNSSFDWHDADTGKKIEGTLRDQLEGLWKVYLAGAAWDEPPPPLQSAAPETF